MTDRAWLQSALSESGVLDDADHEQMDRTMKLPSKELSSSSRQLSKWSGTTRSSPELLTKRPWGCSQAQVRRKQEQLDELRKQDQLRIADTVERRKHMRAMRAQRLMAATTGSAEWETAMQLRNWLSREEDRKKELHAERVKEVFEPIEDRLSGRLHWEQDRKHRQAVTGRRSIAFADEPLRAGDARGPVTAWRLEQQDPVHRQQWQHAQEEAFHREACKVIKGLSRTISDLDQQAKTRPVLEPWDWEPVRLQGTMFGNNERLFDNPARGTWHPGDAAGQGATVLKRGGPGKFVPCEADGVPAAGKRSIRSGPRATSHHDTGLLTVHSGPGHSLVPATLGEAARYRTSAGASSAAPLQDHYTYDRGNDVVDMEFPLGKRTSAGFPFR